MAEKNDLNAQLQAVHARLDRIDDDLIAHYAGISRIIIGMSKNKYVWKIGLRNLITYNMSSLGQTAVRKLLHLIPGYDLFKKLQHLDAAALVSSIESSIEDHIANIADTLTDAINTAITDHLDKIAEQLTATATKAAADLAKNAADIALATAIANNEGADIIAQKQADVTTAITNVTNTTAALGKANTALTNATADLAQINKATGSLDGFMSILDNIAKGKTKSGIFITEK